MKTSLISLLTTVALVGCSSDPSAPGQGVAGQAGQAAAGQSSTAAGAGGLASSIAGAPSGGSAGDQTGGLAGSVGTPTAGSGGNATAGSGGTTGGSAGSAGTTAGSSGAAGSAGSAPVDPGNLPNMMPQGYTGMPFGAAPITIPGKVEVELYDKGGLNVGFKASTDAAFNRCMLNRTDAVKLQCTGQGGPQDQDYATCANFDPGSVYIGYINTGDWFKYTVNVVQDGTYVISGHEGVAGGNTQVSFVFTDTQKTGAVTLPSTNGKCSSEAYHVWAVQDKLAEITLKAGKYVMTLNVVSAALNMDYFAFTKKP